MKHSVCCPYCKKEAEFLPTSEKIYRGRDYGPVYVCWGCSAWVGCHKGTKSPLGRLANAELRSLKQKAHAAFDPLWQDKLKKTRKKKQTIRNDAYQWLSEQIGVTVDKCHIGMFDEFLCERVIDVCRKTNKGKYPW